MFNDFGLFDPIYDPFNDFDPVINDLDLVIHDCLYGITDDIGYDDDQDDYSDDYFDD